MVDINKILNTDWFKLGRSREKQVKQLNTAAIGKIYKIKVKRFCCGVFGNISFVTFNLFFIKFIKFR